MATVDRESEGKRYADGYYGKIFWDDSQRVWVVPSRSEPDRVHFVSESMEFCSCWDSTKNEELCAHARGVTRHVVRVAWLVKSRCAPLRRIGA